MTGPCLSFDKSKLNKSSAYSPHSAGCAWWVRDREKLHAVDFQPGTKSLELHIAIRERTW
jgi:hypothetical protein